MGSWKRTLGCAALLAFGFTALAAEPGRTLRVEQAWARATPPGSSVAAAYLVIDNQGSRSDRLLALTSPRADRVEVHATVHEGDVARMRRVDPLHLAARERLTMEPGGMHVMLIGLTAPLSAGERIPLLLRFELAGELRTELRVFDAGTTDAGKGHHDH